MKNPDNQFILITGASRGIGKAIALQLEADGFPLILHARCPENLTALWEELQFPDKHVIRCADLADQEALKKFTKTISREFQNQFFGLINNAGMTSDKAIAYQPEREIDRLLQVNLKAPIMLGKMALKQFIKQGEGVIINLGSIVGERGNSFQSVYAATKAAMAALAKSWARECGTLLDDHCIRVLSVSPGFIATDMTGVLDEQVVEQYRSSIPTNRIGTPQEVANLVSFLVGPEATYLNGSEFKINGGLS